MLGTGGTWSTYETSTSATSDAVVSNGGTMNALERKLIDGTMKMETELEGLKLPAYGSLFLQNSLPSEYSRYTFPSDLDPTGVFCVGPSCSRAACHKTSIQLDVGPCEFCEFPSIYVSNSDS